MTSLEWHPAPYSAGSIDGAGLRRLLGASVHDRLSLLVRETLQNSWDASRSPGGAPVRPVRPSYTVSLRSATDEDRRSLRTLFGDPDEVPGLPLASELRADRLLLLEISDRGTAGLGGPVDPAQPVEDGLPSDFVDLMFNIGAPQDTDMGGGTFGFGKIASYAVSRASTIVVHSQPLVGLSHHHPGQPRLLASAIGDGFVMDGRRYTGRHWWGDPEEAPLPVLGAGATELATSVFEQGFGQGETGTSILVLQPDLEHLSAEEAATRIVSSVLWNAWPKLLPPPGTEDPPMRVRVLLEGEEVEIPDPSTTRPFIGFAASLQEVRRQQAAGKAVTTEWSVPDGRPRHTRRRATRSVDSGNPKAHVGVIAAVESLNMPTVPRWSGDDEERDASGVQESLHHLALMRGAELVVTYVAGPAHPDQDRGVEWSGVFKCDPGVDRHFAFAEPPSHDEWLVGQLETREAKVIVRRGREYGPRNFFGSLFGNEQGPAAPAGGEGLAHVVEEHLGGLVGRGLAPSGGGSRGGGGGGASRNPGTVTGAEPVELDGRPVLVVDYVAPTGTRLRATGEVKLVSGRSGDEVELVGWGARGAERPSVEGVEHVVDGGGGRVWLAQPEDATVQVRLVVA